MGPFSYNSKRPSGTRYAESSIYIIGGPYLRCDNLIEWYGIIFGFTPYLTDFLM